MELRAQAIRRSFAGQKVLDTVELHLPAGGSCAITGASGSGKSTLLQILTGMDRPDAGQVFWDDIDIHQRSQAARNRLFQQRIGWLSQAPLLDPRASALGNCLLPARFQHVAEAEARACRLLAEVGLGEHRDKTVQQLSGGQQVRCALARTLLHRPPLVIADEPTGTLDDETATAVADRLLALAAEEGFGLLIATHDKHLASRCARHLHLEGGRLHEPAATGLA